MRLEHLPIILGILVLVAAAGVICDAFTPDGLPQFRERRRRARAPRNPYGQGMIGAGMAGMAAALIGRDTWKYGTVAVIAAVVLLVAGGLMNQTYLKEVLFHRGAARRRDEEDQPPDAPSPTKYRIR